VCKSRKPIGIIEVELGSLQSTTAWLHAEQLTNVMLTLAGDFSIAGSIYKSRRPTSAIDSIEAYGC
jgi:hypothetical protein